MRYLITSLLAVLFFSQQPAFASDTKEAQMKSSEIDKINKFFDAYMAKYNHYLATKEFNEVPYLYNDTIMVMSSSVVPYTIESSAFYDRTQSFLDNLQKQGVQRVGWVDVNVHIIDKNLALASNTAARFLENGEEFNRVGVTYFMRKNDDGWRITSFTVHSPSGVVAL